MNQAQPDYEKWTHESLVAECRSLRADNTALQFTLASAVESFCRTVAEIGKKENEPIKRIMDAQQIIRDAFEWRPRKHLQ